MSSTISSDTEINSSPIGIHEFGGDQLISSKPSNRHQKRPKVVDDENEDISLWSEAKRQSWAAINTNPNAFFYRHCAPGEQKRNGAWDPYEKKLFLETMKVHPPSQGRWGLFAQHIPGRVGYQCRNYYHRLLESGEIKALPEEIEKMQRPRKRKATSSKQVSKRPKVEISEEPEIEVDEMKLSSDDKESSSPSESEEITLSQVNKLAFTSKGLNEQETDSNQVSSRVDSQDHQDIDSYQYEVITYLDNDLVPPQDADVAPQVNLVNDTEQIEKLPVISNEPNQIITDNVQTVIPQIKEENQNVVKWTPRMAEPWKTLTPEQIEKLKLRNEQPFQYEASRILSHNFNNPLNLILFSLKVDNSKIDKYVNAVRDHLANDDQPIIDELLKLYFQAIDSDDGADSLADYIISTAKPSYM